MNQGARDENESSHRRATATREETMITLLREIRGLLQMLVQAQSKHPGSAGAGGPYAAGGAVRDSVFSDK